MNPTLTACLRSWPWDPGLLAALVLTAVVYGRGWRELRRRNPARWRARQLTAFLAAQGAIGLALASPIEPLSGLLFGVHMTQHLLLMMLAPPLVWLGDPLLPLVRGLPRPIRHYWVRPLLQSRSLRRALARLSHPAAAWPIYVAATWLWHLPSMFQLALRSGGWHWLEHASFFAAALLFWYPVVRPYPARPAWSTWWLVPYLILADVQNTVLSAIFAFADHPLYPHYADVPRLGGLSAIDDQRLAGVLMWVPGSVAFLLPLFVIGLRLLKGPAAALGPALPNARSTRPAGYAPLPIVVRAACTRGRPIACASTCSVFGSSDECWAGALCARSCSAVWRRWRRWSSGTDCAGRKRRL